MTVDQQDWTKDEDTVGTVLVTWLGVLYDEVDRAVVEADAGRSWEDFDASVRTYLRDLDPGALGSSSSKSDVVLRALQLEALVEAGRCGPDLAPSLFRALTGHPESFLEELVIASIGEISEQCRKEYLYLTKKKKKKRKTELDCGTHGKSVWKGTVVCEDCGAVWQTEDEDAPHYAPEVCTCGVRLMPDPLSVDGRKIRYSALPICGDCYEERVGTAISGQPKQADDDPESP